ncbi:MAG TPA: hypothetical protein VFW77_01980 [Candidatus Saccharimonadales bacterium]|nr:hypothetical protein [Candidatus Saccharimonadales bacterium]
MTAKEYIISTLEALAEPVQMEDIGRTPPEDKIIQLITTKKFRKYSLDPERLEQIKSAVSINVNKNEPIKFTVPFGGYKLWRLSETPEPDWAELFTMVYYTKWIKPICEIYKPGVWFDFFSDDAVIKRMNNIPPEDTQAYRETFKKLLKFIKPYQPENLDMTYNRVGDRYENQKAFDDELDRRIVETKAEFNGGFPPLDESWKKMVELNVNTTPEQTKDPEWREKVFLVHEAYGKMSQRRPYYRTPEKIMVVTTPLGGSLCVGTTKDSIAKFWCGGGALKVNNDSFRQLVLTPSQLENAKFGWENVKLEGLKGKNFSKIRILN